MNEHIEDLMYQSGLTAQGCWDEMDTYDRGAIERLIVLVVRECADISDASFHNGSAGYTAILKNFGLNE